jgi:hypothetical protein
MSASLRLVSMGSDTMLPQKGVDVELIGSLLLVDTVYFSHVPVATSKLTSSLPTDVISADQVSS